MIFKEFEKNQSLEKLKIIFLTLIPLTLIFSIKWNSYIIIATLILFIPQIIENRKKIKSKTFLYYFLPLLSFVICVLIGTGIDFYYGFFDLKKIERLLPFIIFPLIFFIGLKGNTVKFNVIKLFSYSITIINIVLLLLAFSNFFEGPTSNQFQDSAWIKSNVMVSESDFLSPNQKDKSTLIIENTNNELHDLTYNVFDNIKSEFPYIRSVYLKYHGREWVLIRHYDGFEHKGVWFNIKQGIIGHQQKGVIGKIEKIKDGWFRCSVINVTSNRTKRERIQITLVEGNKKYTSKGDGKSGLYIWGALIEKGNVASKYEINKMDINYKILHREFLLGPLDTHPTYYSIFVIFSILFLITQIFSTYRVILILAIIFNVAIVILISSKGAILSLLLMLILLSFYYFKRSKYTLIFLTFTLSIVSIMIMMSPTLIKRINQSIDTIIYTENKGLSTSDRLIVWNSIFKFSKKELLLGMGNTNGDNLLKEKSNLDLNTHNQYFQALINSGFIGLIFLLIYLFYPLFIWKMENRNNIFIIGLIIIFGVNFIFESILNRQWGIVFISFFYSLICSSQNQRLLID